MDVAMTHRIAELPQAAGFDALCATLDTLSAEGWACFQVHAATHRHPETGEPKPVWLLFLRRKKVQIHLPTPNFAGGN